MGLAVYCTRHAQALLGSTGRLARNPLATALTVLVIGLALALPLGLEMLVSNVADATGGFSGALDLSVYFKPGVPLAKAQQLAGSVRARAGVAGVTVIPADQGLEEFRRYSGFGAALQGLEGNPLPHVLRIRPTAEGSAPAALEALRRYLAAWPEVDSVQADMAWVARFDAILELLRRLLALAAVLLALGVLAVIGNTVRLEIQSRRPEIEVVKLVGGTDGFVRRPFLYTGALYGLAGALTAWAVVEAGVLLLRPAVATLAALYGSRYALAAPDPRVIAALLAGGLGLGWLGAWVSSARHLARIQPRA